MTTLPKLSHELEAVLREARASAEQQPPALQRDLEKFFASHGRRLTDE